VSDGVAQGTISYIIDGTVGRMEHSGSSPSTATDAYFRIELTVTDFTPTWFEIGPAGNFAVASALVTAPAFGISNSRVLNQNLEVFFFDDGYHEQFALNLILESSPASRTYDNILLDAYGWDFIGNPRVISPLNRSMSSVGIAIGGGWRNAFQLEDGTTLGLWYGPLYGVLQNGTPIPEPRPASILLICAFVLILRAWRRYTRHEWLCGENRQLGEVRCD
jgi:hypothetical protein